MTPQRGAGQYILGSSLTVFRFRGTGQKMYGYETYDLCMHIVNIQAYYVVAILCVQTILLFTPAPPPPPQKVVG